MQTAIAVNCLIRQFMITRNGSRACFPTHTSSQHSTCVLLLRIVLTDGFNGSTFSLIEVSVSPFHLLTLKR